MQFSLAPIAKEGAPAHPDIYDNSDELSDARYKKQLEAYMEVTGDKDAWEFCVRKHLWP